jgi:hypothetical protein
VILGIEAIVTAELFNHYISLIRLMNKCTRCDLYLLGHPNERTTQPADEQGRCMRSGFLVFCVFDPQDISGILYQSMLKATSGSDERPALLTSEPDRPERAAHALIWAGGSAPERIKLL